MTIPPEDPSPRVGSATSLVMTIVGIYLRRLGGWIATSDLVALADEVTGTGAMTRTSIARLKKRGILDAEPRGATAGYALRPGATPIFERGDVRIFDVRTMQANDPWCLISFSVPEDQRQLRGRLRRRLSWIGCGIVAPALWIAPDFLRAEVEEILDELAVRHLVTLFRTSQPSVGGPFDTAVARWWDLDRLSALHQGFIDSISPLLTDAPRDDADAFRRYVLGMDAWRVIPYLDPGLPFDYLPDDWPGQESVATFTALSPAFAERAWRHVEARAATTR